MVLEGERRSRRRTDALNPSSFESLTREAMPREGRTEDSTSNGPRLGGNQLAVGNLLSCTNHTNRCSLKHDTDSDPLRYLSTSPAGPLLEGWVSRFVSRGKVNPSLGSALPPVARGVSASPCHRRGATPLQRHRKCSTSRDRVKE